MISPYQIRTVLLHSERIIYIYALSYIFLPLWWDTLRIYVGPLSESTCWWYKFFKNFITTAVLLGFNFIILVRVSNNMAQDGRTDLNKKLLPRTKARTITVFFICLHTPSFLLEIRVIIKISSPFLYHINSDWFE